MPPTILTQDTLTWYRTDVPPWEPDRELLVEAVSGYHVILAGEPWPYGAFRWAMLPRR